jgi:hypothetical protein
MIDLITGELSLPSGVRIGPSLTHDLFIQLPLPYRLSRKSPEVSVYIYQLPSQRTLNHSVNVLLDFMNNILVEVHLRLDDDIYGGPSSERSGPRELERKQVHDKWLAETLGPKHEYRYPWGKVESVYNDNTVSSYIIIKYEPT